MILLARMEVDAFHEEDNVDEYWLHSRQYFKL